MASITDFTSPSRAAPADRASAAVGVWLIVVAVMVFAMVIVGGATRLTDSGLSITEWRPIHGVIPPLNHAEWMEEFNKYREIAQYRYVNAGMSLGEFQFIYWWEWAHRLLGRVVGVVFLVPLIFFMATRQLGTGLAPRLWIMFALGGLQGAIGWWMVASGIGTERVQVAAYRLATHLGMAFALFGLLWWTALDVLAKARRRGDAAVFPWAAGFAALVFVQVILGAFVAGTDAGFRYNDWPLMDGAWLPTEYFRLSPWPLNLVENLQAIQFNHRVVGYLAAAVAVVVALKALKSRDGGVRTLGIAALVATAFQVALGIVTLIGFGVVAPPAVPGVLLGVAHQGFAVILFGAALTLAWRTRAA
jgi:heme a synthase